MITVPRLRPGRGGRMSNYRRDPPPLEVVMWLNYRLGHSVNVSIKLDRRDVTVR